MAYLSSISSSIRGKIWRWFERRSPRSRKVTLQHKSIYVLPTRQGLLFLLVIIIMWLLGTNYENNLILAAAFLLISVMLVSIVHAYKNLSGLAFQAITSVPAFAGEYAEFFILVNSAKGSSHENIQIALDSSLPVTLDLISTHEQQLKLVAHSRTRGWLIPRRLLVETFFPLGVMRAWSWVQLDMQALIYPAPLKGDEPPLAHYGAEEGDILARDNPEDFYGLAPYQPGMPLARIAWKQYSRGAGLHLKDYVGYQSQDVWLDWHALTGLDTETRLSQLCYWVLELSKTSTQYGLRLPHELIELGSGEPHTALVLRALALYKDQAGPQL